MAGSCRFDPPATASDAFGGLNKSSRRCSIPWTPWWGAGTADRANTLPHKLRFSFLEVQLHRLREVSLSMVFLPRGPGAIRTTYSLAAESAGDLENAL